MQEITLEKILAESTRAMIIGIGGGGDVVGTIPTANLLKTFGIECILGGISWERSVHDPQPGPRSFDEVRNAEKINDYVWYASSETVTKNGIKFSETGLSEVIGSKTLLVDINPGPGDVSKSLQDAADKLGCDLLIGLDVGGDSVALGNEKGLMSPLADSIMISAINMLRKKLNCILGIFGLGSDGELTLDELEYVFKMIAGYGGIIGSWGITRDTLRLLQEIISVVPTEASRCPVEYALGMFEESTIRRGTRYVKLNLSSTSTYYLDPTVIYEKISKTARAVTDCKSLESASRKLNDLGIKTELDIEMENFQKLS